MSDWPRMQYRHPSQGVGACDLQDGRYDTRVILSDDERSDGWHDTPAQALEAGKPPVVVAPPLDAPPTRAELEQKARELGIRFDGRTADRTLAEQIKARL